MYPWLVPTVIVPVYEALTGRRAWTAMRRLRQLQWLPVEELEARALTKLRDLLAHAAVHVPYYRDLLHRSGVHPEDIRSLSDLARVPVTTKPALRGNFPGRTVADNVPRHRFTNGATSGSTGTPFQFYTDRATRDERHGTYLFFLHWAGAALWDTRFVIGPGGGPPEAALLRAARRLALGEHVVSLSGIDVTFATLSELIDRTVGHGRYFIQAYPSYATRLAAEILERGLALKRYPSVVVTMSETLTEINAETLRRAFRCPVVNHYSTWEVLHIAQSCPDNQHLLHVNSERAVVRIIREDGTHALAGEPGRVLITDLSNMVMPFINYDLGDQAVVGPACPCGRGFPTIQRLDGRAGEVIQTPDGKVIAPGAITRRLTPHAAGYVWEYQVVQTTPDAVTLRVVPSQDFSESVARVLEADMRELLGPTVRATVETVDRIATESSGKRLIIKPLSAAVTEAEPGKPAT